MTAENPERCDLCRWWQCFYKVGEGLSADHNEGTCRLNPPKLRKDARMDQAGGPRAIDFAAPVTYGMNFCAGFKEK